MKKIVFAFMLIVSAAHAKPPLASSRDQVTKALNSAQLPSQAAKDKVTKVLDSDNTQTLTKRAQDYLNGLKTFKANFTESSHEGCFSGVLYWSRPDKFKLAYHAPKHQIIIVKDGILHHIDTKTNEHQTFGLSQTPAALLLRKEILFNKNVSVLNTAISEDSFAITVADPENEQGPSLTLVFKTKPYFLLHFWTVNSPDNKGASVQLDDIEIGMSVSEKVFSIPD